MATRSTLGYRKADGSIVGVYCHWDGYPEWMVPAIEGFISTHGVRKFMADIRRGIKQGGVRSASASTIETYGDYRGEVSEGDEYARNRSDVEGDRHDEYAYVVCSRSGEIVEFYSTYDGGLTPIGRMYQAASGEESCG